jgi:hypothetical protein
MRNPEYKDKLSDYSAADRAIIQASLNSARLANKKGTAKKTVKPISKKTSPKMPGKGPAVKVTDSRFSGVKKPSVTKPKDSRFTGTGAGKPKPSGTGGYTPGSAKSSKSTYTTGSGVRYASATKKAAAPASKTKQYRYGGFSMLSDAFTPDWKKREQAAKAAKKSK